MKIISLLTSRGFAIALLILSLALLFVFKYLPEYHTKWVLVFPLFIFVSISLSLYRRIKNRRAAWTVAFSGSVLFHVGMLVVMASLMTGEVLRYWVNVSLPRNIPVVVETSPLSRIITVPLFQAQPFVKIVLDWQDSSFEEGAYAVDHAAGLIVGLIEEDNYKESFEVIRVNKPVWRNGFQFLLRGGGFVYLLKVTDKDGKKLTGEHRRAPGSISEEDSFSIGSEGVEFFVRYFPELFFKDNKYSTLSREALNPALGVRVVSKENPFEDVWKGIIKSREVVDTGDYTLEFVDLRPYVSIEILKDPSYYGIVVGWLLIVLGLLMRYLFVKELSKEIG